MEPRQLSFELFPRHAAAWVSAALADTRVVDYVERALRGGFPEAVRRVDPSRRARFAETVRAEDFRGLHRLAGARTGDRFHAGYVLYAGAEVLSFGPRLRAVPISAL